MAECAPNLAIPTAEDWASGLVAAQAGWRFTVGDNPLLVCAFRYYFGAAESETLRLWRVSDETLLASYIIGAGEVDSYSEISITPIILEANTDYLITHRRPDGSSHSIRFNPDSATFHSAITFVENRLQTTDNFPTNTSSSDLWAVDFRFGFAEAAQFNADIPAFESALTAQQNADIKAEFNADIPAFESALVAEQNASVEAEFNAEIPAFESALVASAGPGQFAEFNAEIPAFESALTAQLDVVDPTLTLEELLATDDYQVVVRVFVGQQDDELLTNLSTYLGRDWLNALVINDDIDTPTSGLSVTLGEADGSISLAPLKNPDSPVRAGRYIRVEDAVVSPSATFPLPVVRWEGEIDDLIWGRGENTLTLECRDLGAKLQDHLIRTEREYGTSAGVPVEGEMQKILDDNSMNVAMLVPQSPGWFVRRWRQEKVQVFEANQSLADQIGWRARYKPNDDNDGEWRYTLYDPGRDKTEPEYTLTEAIILNTRGVDQSRRNIRNSVSVYFTDASGNRNVWTETSPESIAEFDRELHMDIERGSSDLLRTAVEAERLAKTAVHDLAFLKADTEIETHYFPYVRLHQLIEINAPSLIGSVDNYSVVGYSHRVADGQARTRIALHRGAPIGMTVGWIERLESARKPKPRRPPAPRTPVNTDTLTLTTGIQKLELVTRSWVRAAWSVTAWRNARAFDVRYRIGSSNDYNVLSDIEETHVKWDAVAGLTYRVSVRALDDEGNASPWSGEQSITAATSSSAPSAPTGVAAQGIISGISVRWAVPTQERYLMSEVHVSTSSGFTPSSSTLAGAGRTPVEVESVGNQRLTPGTTYWARVVHVDAQGNRSGASASASAIAGRVGTFDILEQAISRGQFVSTTTGTSFEIDSTSFVTIPNTTVTLDLTGHPSSESVAIKVGAALSVIMRWRPVTISETGVLFECAGLIDMEVSTGGGWSTLGGCRKNLRFYQMHSSDTPISADFEARVSEQASFYRVITNVSGGQSVSFRLTGRLNSGLSATNPRIQCFSRTVGAVAFFR